MRATDESTGYIRRDGFGSEMDFGPRVLDFSPMIMVLKGLHVSMNACFIILPCESPLNGIHVCFSIPMTLMLAFFQLYLLGLMAHVCLYHSR